MLTRSLIVATTVLACVAIPLSDVEAKSNNNSHNGNNATNHQGSSHPGSSGNGTAQVKQKQKKRGKVTLGTIPFVKHYDKSSP